jgi:hypothetical protein
MTKPPAKTRLSRPPLKAKPGEPVLLSGGNPQIPKGYGDEPVKAWIAAAPGWKGPLAKRIDALIVKAVPGVKKAVKWNTPLYGAPDAVGDVFFMGFHAYDRYIKVSFFKGASLEPLPPGASKQAEVRYYDIHESELDEAQFTAWVKQAVKLPGEKM